MYLWCSIKSWISLPTSLPHYSKMPPNKDQNSKYSYNRSFSNNETTMSAKVYHPATNLMPVSPPHTPTGVPPSFGSKSTNTWSRQNSHSGKYS
ncbi:unnamed protein product [Arctia plantaginis]|nr:unnamed protein product [Arctia plantaginis]